METTLRRRMLRVLKTLAYLFFLLGSTLGLLELAYRRQWIDFYANELRGLNRPVELNVQDKRFTLLVLGDSFSAQPFSYVQTLRDSLPGARIINAAVPGTGILEAGILARRRLREFPPDALLYQVYVGNDLWDLRKTTDSPRISRARNGYWRLAEYSLFLRFLNYRLGQLKSTAGVATETRELKLEDIPYSPDGYARRERLLFQAEPALLQHSVLATGRRKEDLSRWLLCMDELLKNLPQRTQTVLIVPVPHCAQLNSWYSGHMEQLGAAPFPAVVQAQDYPFLERIRAHFAHDARVRVLSPLPVLQQQDSIGRRMYYENDPHLSSLGQAVLGRYLLPELKGLYR